MLYEITKSMNEIIESGDENLIRAYFTHLFPLLPQSNRNRFHDYEFLDIIQSEEPNLKKQADLVVELAGFNERSSEVYIKRFLGYNQPDRLEKFKYCDIALESLGKHTPIMFATACVVGDPDTAMRILEIHGNVQLSISSGSPTRVNGDDFYAYNEKMVNTDAESIRRCVKLLEDAGAASLLFKDYKGEDRPHESRYFSYDRSRFSNTDRIKLEPQEIPEFVNGQIKNAELLHAMKQRAESDRLVDSYRRVPCWIKEEDLDAFSSVRVYRAIQKLSIKDNAFDYKEFCPSNFGSIDPSTMNNVIMTLAEDSNFKCTENLSSDNMRLHSMMNAITLAGFKHKEGYALCVADVDELMLHRSGNINSNIMKVVTDKVSRLASHDYLSAIYGDHHVELGIVGNYKIASLLTLLSNEPELMAELRVKLGENNFLRICERNKLTVDVLVSLNRNFGYNNKHFPITISSLKSLYYLHLNSFKFEEGSSQMPKVLDLMHDVSVKFDLNIDTASMLCEMGLWPGEDSTRPDSIEGALKSAVRLISNTPYRGYLKAAGVEKVARACKTPPQWTLFLNIFSEQEIDSVRAMIPKKITRSQISSDFGL